MYACVTRAAARHHPQAPSKPKRMTYKERADAAPNAMAKRLLAIMDRKKTNLAVAADVEKAEDVVALADKIGPHICCLKTHCDIHPDWSDDIGKRLAELAQKHDFVVFEDRKFADIGNTVVMQVRERPQRGQRTARARSGSGM